jgi:hypothetical protein
MYDDAVTKTKENQMLDSLPNPAQALSILKARDDCRRELPVSSGGHLILLLRQSGNAHARHWLKREVTQL